MAPEPDATLATAFQQRRAEARAHLAAQMKALGLDEADGWSIAESVRQRADGGCELHMRPLHLRLTAPDDLECVVKIDLTDETVDADCTP